MLSRLLDGRIAWRPRPDEGAYESAGWVRYGRLLSGIVFTQGVASLSIPSWNQLLAWLKHLETLMKAASAA